MRENVQANFLWGIEWPCLILYIKPLHFLQSCDFIFLETEEYSNIYNCYIFNIILIIHSSTDGDLAMLFMLQKNHYCSFNLQVAMMSPPSKNKLQLWTKLEAFSSEISASWDFSLQLILHYITKIILLEKKNDWMFQSGLNSPLSTSIKIPQLVYTESIL